jgi:hypothetical protein
VRRPVLCLGLLAACVTEHPRGRHHPDAPDAPPPPPDAPADALVSLPLGVGHYRGQCDGSAGIALDFTHFITLSDEDQRARTYERGASGDALSTVDLTSALNLTANTDLEDAVRVGDHLFAISSHGRKNDGTLDRNRYRFIGLTLDLQPIGRTERLLDDMLDRTTWGAPDDTVLAALANASQLGRNQVSNLAPKIDGTNIEGIARAPAAGAPDRLAIAFRNPRPGGRAIVVTLLNPDATLAGARPQFGGAYQLDLGGLGIRALAWSDPLAALLVIAGPHDDSAGPFVLYRWLPEHGAPERVTELLPPANASPEAIVTYPGTRDVQILFDNDDVAIGGTSCKDANGSDKEFFDQVVHIE